MQVYHHKEFLILFCTQINRQYWIAVQGITISVHFVCEKEMGSIDKPSKIITVLVESNMVYRRDVKDTQT